MNIISSPAILSVGRKDARPLPTPPRTHLESPDSNGGQSSGIALTKKGEAYADRNDRLEIERRIDRHLGLVAALIALLDQWDGDADHEPSLAAPEAHFGDEDQSGWATGSNDDRESDVGDEPEFVNEDGDGFDDLEPSLGWSIPNPNIGQEPAVLAGGMTDDDREADYVAVEVMGFAVGRSSDMEPSYAGSRK